MPIPAILLERVDTFARNLDSYLDPDYKEARLRREFLDPLFEALGWDIANNNGYAEAYKDVVHEDTLKLSGVAATAPDYSFRVGGTRKFFVEAKKPSVKIKEDPGPAAQLRRYSYSAKLPLGIVTDFHEFAIYDTRQRPRENDKASVGRIFYCTFDQYPEKWDEIAAIFSRESILRGSFDKYAASNKGKRGTSEFDDDFLADMERWRDLLARNLALRNTLTQRDLNFAVQRILDRIVFLRIAEDRGIEPYGQLLGLTAGPKIYPRLCEVFERADFRYNSGLFHFATEKGRDESPDKLTLGLELDDAVLKEIVGSLYWPKSPYAFAVIPADILGHVYEQFLGKVIHLTSDHKAHVEEKPEVRKAGGVYYTPTYIVRYIVEQTVGPLVQDKTPKQVEKLKVLDPACGSGSFLLGAYEFLLGWHLDYYLKNDPAAWAKKKHPPLYETAPNAQGLGRGSGNWLLTTAERKRILVNNLFGVDIDAQAVEVTKLSLLLKVLEGEARELQGKQLDFHRVLPDLGNNIKCGNSLIGSDFYAQPDLPELDDEARLKINAFDWTHEFKPIMDAGGFNAVIGNPPYVRIQGFPPEQLAYFSSTYSAATGNYDLYVNFVDRAVSVMNKTGRLGFILPNKFIKTDYGEGLRTLLSSGKIVASLVDFGAEQVFDATTYTCLLFLDKTGTSQFRHATASASAKALELLAFQEMPATTLNSAPWKLGGQEIDRLLAKLTSQSKRLLDIPADMSRGSSTGDDEVFVLASGAASKLETSSLRIPLYAQDFNRYRFRPTGEWKVIFPYDLSGNNAQLITIGELRSRSPKTFDYLQAHQSTLQKRKQFREWHGYSAARNLKLHESAQIAVPLLANKGMFALIPESYRSKICPMASGGFTIALDKECPYKPEYILGLLNSKLLFWVLEQSSNIFRGGWITCTKQYFGDLPIRALDMSSKAERGRHDFIVSHVERMLKLHADLAAAKSPGTQTHLEREIAATDRAIDQLVYQLYELTPEEVALVEQATAPAAKAADEAPEAVPAAPPTPPEAYLQAEADAAHHFFVKESKSSED
ncbi:MAG: N-6 DNA methylase [Verrucomicrobiota bacterium]